MFRSFGLLLLLIATELPAADPADKALQHSIEQLRSVIGPWSVSTEFLNDDGSVAKSVQGSYAFSWVVPDRVVSGRSDIPELEQSAAILFYIDQARGKIEMASVGGDGRLWVMTGPLGGEQRTTAQFETAQGSSQLRFTRFNVGADRFESKMEYSEDGGASWKPGNHQLFKRTTAAAEAHD